MLNYKALWELAEQQAWKAAALLYPPDLVKQRQKAQGLLVILYYRQMTQPPYR